MKALLIGATGQLGGDLVRNNPGHEILAPPRAALDLERMGEAAALLAAARPDVVINCAAFHNVPLCEAETGRAFQVNCIAVRDLARACRRLGARLVIFSTDYVFGGDKRTPYAEDDRPMPLQVYGITRLAGEYAALSEAPESALVIRTCGLYGRSGARSKGGNFVDQRIAEALAATSIEMANDQTVSPTSSDDLSRAVFELIAHPRAEPGVYHLVNEGQCTWYEFTRAVFELTGIACRVVPVDRGGRTGDMRRPLYSALANNRASALGIRLPPWRTALERYLGAKAGKPG
jgi:dTDP-4-dehydrorhamnose reductase